AALRRSRLPPARDDGLTLGRVAVDFSRMTVRGPDADGDLTRSEALFLKLLKSERGRCFSYDEIFAALRGADHVGDDNAVRCLVKRLKAKLGPAGEMIVNVRGVGYKLLR
ncbi:MAG: response regulator transcription factor, partial [Kiritimatiellae bacterium]|nr:response regulator transcription factor [Kiritimatiellia bacterium]